ncbi:MAG: hypothetical protein IT208_07405 [Chthonomonadales bacterium]|nr:hypothetical protein [Chthonomonadales bacterium]
MDGLASTRSLSPAGQRASLGATLLTVLLLASVTAVWAALCPTGRIPIKHYGGGACQCDIYYCLPEPGGGQHCWCMSDYHCENGSQDYLAILGGCLTPLDQELQCREDHADWTQHFFSTSDCHMDQVGRVPAGTCQIDHEQANSSIYGWNGPEGCSRQ